MCIQEPTLPVEVILHILSQVYVEEDEVVHVAPRERDLETLTSQPAAPLLDAQDCVVHDFRCRLHVLQDTLQGHILTGNSCFQGLAMKCRVHLHKRSLSITEDMVTCEELTLLYSINICKGHNSLVYFLSVWSGQGCQAWFSQMLPVIADLEKLPSRGERPCVCLTLLPRGLEPARLLCPVVFQARILEWVAISSSRGSSRLRDQTCTSCTVRQALDYGATGATPWGAADPLKAEKETWPIFKVSNEQGVTKER